MATEMSDGRAICGECGMPCEVDEYHPFAACLMFKQGHNSETVRANLKAVEDAAYQRGLRDAKQAVEAEPELPGPMPSTLNYIFESYGLMAVCRAAVRSTKKSISNELTRLAEGAVDASQAQ